MNTYQWSVLAGLFAFAVNEVRSAELNDIGRYSTSRLVSLWMSYVYVAASVIGSAIFLFLKLGTL